MGFLGLLFGGRVQPASALLSGGPHCVKHVSYGGRVKVFFFPSYVMLGNAIKCYVLLFQTL
jgi:hypothetical protein